MARVVRQYRTTPTSEDSELQDQGQRQRLPDFHTNADGRTRRDRKIRPMHHEIQQPMADDCQTAHPRSARVSAQKVINRPETDAPKEHHHEAVRYGVVREIEGRHPGDAGRDCHPLETHEQQGRPQEIDELRREKQRAERGPRGSRLGPEADSKVSEKHLSSLLER